MEGRALCVMEPYYSRYCSPQDRLLGMKTSLARPSPTVHPAGFGQLWKWLGRVSNKCIIRLVARWEYRITLTGPLRPPPGPARWQPLDRRTVCPHAKFAFHPNLDPVALPLFGTDDSRSRIQPVPSADAAKHLIWA
jgi:hypothetical protein